jgi:hypothetical protein
MSAEPESRFVPYHLPFAAAAWGLFALSLFLPACDVAARDPLLGWRCAVLSITSWFWPWDTMPPIPFFRVHLMLLSFPNLFMIVSPFFAVVPGGTARTKQWLWRWAAVCVLLTVTFILEFARGNELRSLHIGYFVWVFSFGLLGLSFVRGEARPG